MCQLPQWRLDELTTLNNTTSSEDISPPDTPIASTSDTVSLTPITPTGLSPLEAYEDEAILNNGVRDGNAADLIHGLVLSVGSEAPEIAAAVTDLQIVHHYMPYELVPPSLGALRLPNLRMLRLTGVVVTPSSLLALLQQHKSTLKVISLDCVALAIPRMEETGPASKRYRWTKLINYIRTKMRVEYLFLNSLTWCDGDSGKMCDSYLQTKQAKYHWRFLQPEGRDRFKLSNGGLEAKGCQAVRYGIDMFVDEVNKGPRRRQTTTARN